MTQMLFSYSLGMVKVNFQLDGMWDHPLDGPVGMPVGDALN